MNVLTLWDIILGYFKNQNIVFNFEVLIFKSKIETT